MKKFVSILICVLMISSVAYANNVESTFKASDFSLNVKGILGSSSGELFTLNLLNNSNSISADNIPFYSSAYVTGANGAFNIDVLLPATIASGKWYVRVGSAIATQPDSFMIVNPDDANTKRVLAAVKSSSSITELYNALNASTSGVDDITYVGFDKPENLSDICDVLYYELKNSNEDVQLINTDDFYHTYRRVQFFTDLKTGADFDDAVNKYFDSMNIKAEEYVSLASDVKSSFKSIFVNSDYTVKSLNELFVDSMFFVKLKALESLGDCETLITDNAEFLSINMESGSKYQKIPSAKRYKVFQKIYESKNELNSVENVKSVFDATVEEVLKDIETPKKPISTGGGGSSASSTVKVDTNYTQDMPVTIVPEPVSLFNDIDNSFAKSQIEALAKSGIISGYADGSFKPENNVTRAEFATLIVRALGVEQGATEVEFADVNAGTWYYDAVAKMASNGYISGYNGSFNPDSSITRQDVAVIIYNVFSALFESSTSATYNDSSDISSYAVDAISAVSQAQIMQGYENKFRPKDYITRAETAVLISNILSFTNK